MTKWKLDFCYISLENVELVVELDAGLLLYWNLTAASKTVGVDGTVSVLSLTSGVRSAAGESAGACLISHPYK